MTERLWLVWAAIVRNPFLKVISFLLALLAWLWVQQREFDVVQVRVPVDFTFAPGLVSVDELPAAVTVSLEGTRAALRRSEDNGLRLDVDLANEAVGPGDFVLESYELQGLAMGVKVGGIRPDRVRLRIDKRTTRNVPVEPAWLGEPAAGFSIREVVVEPDVAEVAGPRAVLETMAVVRIKPIDLSGWTASGDVAAELDLPRTVVAATPWQGMARVQVEAQTTSRTLSEVPVFVTDPDYVPDVGSETIPVNLTGPTDVLRGLRTDWIVVRVDLPEDAEEDSYRVAFQAASTPRMDVLHPRPDVVRVQTPPPSITVVRR